MSGNEDHDYEHAKSLAAFLFNDLAEKYDLQTAVNAFMEVAKVNEVIEDLK